MGGREGGREVFVWVVGDFSPFPAGLEFLVAIEDQDVARRVSRRLVAHLVPHCWGHRDRDRHHARPAATCALLGEVELVVSPWAAGLQLPVQ